MHTQTQQLRCRFSTKCYTTTLSRRKGVHVRAHMLDQFPFYCFHYQTQASGESKVPSYVAKGSLPLENHSSVARQGREKWRRKKTGWGGKEGSRTGGGESIWVKRKQPQQSTQLTSVIIPSAPLTPHTTSRWRVSGEVQWSTRKMRHLRSFHML